MILLVGNHGWNLTLNDNRSGLRHAKICLTEVFYTVESPPQDGGVAEWLKAAVLKTAEGQPSVSSNLTSSAIRITKAPEIRGFFVSGDFARSGRRTVDAARSATAATLSIKNCLFAQGNMDKWL